MNQPTNICPLRAIASIGMSSGPAVCIEDRCAWWHYEVLTPDITHGQCLMQSIADSLDELNMG